jgi:hypothetical protein
VVRDSELVIEDFGEAGVSECVEIEVNSVSASTSIGVLLIGDDGRPDRLVDEARDELRVTN